MQVREVLVHNFRSISHESFKFGDYSLLVGANNSGKTNFVDALREFYELEKYQRGRDFPRFEVQDKECWMEIEFVLSNDEYNDLKVEYKRPNNRLRVRKNLETTEVGKDKKPKIGIYGYVGELISDELFYGAKNVQQGKLGEVIYIPEVSRLTEHTKLSGPSPLRDLLNDILKKLVKSSESFKKLQDEFVLFSSTFKTEKTGDNKSLDGLEKDISSGLSDWNASFVLDINPVNESDIVKNLVEYRILDGELEQPMDASQLGQGFQRHLIYTLIQTAAKYQVKPAAAKKKDFTPDMTLLLFEEPEAYLHPIQQDILCRSLKSIGDHEGNQVIITTHSPQFVSQNSDDLPSIIRLRRKDKKTVVGQVDAERQAAVFSDNQAINDRLRGTSYEPHLDDYQIDMEAVKYFLWLDPNRCGMFFAEMVLLVEGPTERALFNHLVDEGRLDMPKGGVFFLDCMGKFNIHRFMNILGPLNIRHSVLFDLDGYDSNNDAVAQLIYESKNERTENVDTFENELEDFLGIEKTRPHRKPQHVLLKYKKGEISEERMKELVEKLKALIRSSE